MQPASVVVGWSIPTSGHEAFRWTSDGGTVGLGKLLNVYGAQSFAYDVSADGSVVVGRSSSASGREAFRWTSDGGMVGLGDLPGGSFYSGAWGVSAETDLMKLIGQQEMVGRRVHMADGEMSLLP